VLPVVLQRFVVRLLGFGHDHAPTQRRGPACAGAAPGAGSVLVRDPVVAGRPADEGEPVAETYNGYCVKCKEKRDFEGEVKVSESGRRMAQGTCPVCGTKMNRILGKA
jgi:hypothetical protein